MLGGEIKKHEEAVFGETIENLKANFINENEVYNTLISTKVEKFTERDTAEFKAFLSNFLQDQRKIIDDFILNKYLSKSKTYNIQVAMTKSLLFYVKQLF